MAERTGTLVTLKEEGIATSFLTAGESIVVHIPRWLPHALRTVYVRHEIGHLNYLEQSGLAPKNILEAVIHNLHAFRLELCPCAAPVAAALCTRGEMRVDHLGEVRTLSFLCRRAPGPAALLFLLIAVSTIPFLALARPSSCLRGHRDCLLKKARLP
ncbi:MAG: hypothetical protein HYY01_11815 [Chloroflexi bacterium]|nr:hypothetical protein [Chloroflexota bacterium]